MKVSKGDYLVLTVGNKAKSVNWGKIDIVKFVQLITPTKSHSEVKRLMDQGGISLGIINGEKWVIEI